MFLILSAMKFFTWIIRIESKSRLKLLVYPIIKIKSGLKINIRLFKKLIVLLELGNLDYMYYYRIKPDVVFLKRYFLFDNILLA